MVRYFKEGTLHAKFLYLVVVAAGIYGCGGSNAPMSFLAAGGTTSTGGAASSGGVATTGGGSGSCPFPTAFRWNDWGGPLAEPKNGWVSLKDFSSVVYQGQHLVYSSMHDGASYGAQFMLFDDWSDTATAVQTKLPTGAVAPTIFYFTPKNLWILAYQWCSAKFCYATSTDPTSAASWSFGNPLLTEDITSATYGPIDQTLICDSTKCYLFYAADNGHIYRASMPIADFPGTFSGSTSIISESSTDVFEAVQVYSVKGTGKFLMIVETNASPRYFRAYSADSLDGAFTVIPGAASAASPFAGKSNVTFTGSAWTDDISHGDLVRTNPDETMTVDPCNLQLLYQGRDPTQNSSSYDQRPYRPGLLTKTN
ncbi:MAG TPA: non-reducing end alpha-L-arabinofuranosidase family hydrolase [Polyangiaceae bacterium]|nr:non-reducing end alpha-L-arabinofuranosidase family hydrolase [Polyangiaceae bacterium]